MRERETPVVASMKKNLFLCSLVEDGLISKQESEIGAPFAWPYFLNVRATKSKKPELSPIEIKYPTYHRIP